jgi:hypothetical protein
MRTPVSADTFQADSIQFEEAKTSQSDGGGSFKLRLYVNVKVFLMIRLPTSMRESVDFLEKRTQ